MGSPSGFTANWSESTGSGLLAAIPLVGQFASAIGQGIQNRKSREWNEKMYRIQRQDALTDWQMQNAYNSPAAQMERLRNAGLNPNLVYGNGAQASNASPVRSTDVKGWNPQSPQFDTGSVLGAYYDTQIKNAQLDNLKTQKEVMEQQIKSAVAKELETYANTDKSKSSRDLIDTMVQIRGNELTYAQQFSAGKLEKLRQDTEKVIQDTAKSKAETAYRLHEDERRRLSVNMNLQEAAERILQMRANVLRANAQTINEYFKKDVLMQQAQQIEQSIKNLKTNEELQRQKVRLEQMKMTPYDKEFLGVLEGILGKAMPRVSQKNVDFQRLRLESPAYRRK